MSHGWRWEDVALLTREQAETAAHRFESHGNSALRIARHFRRVDDARKLGMCRALRRIERQFAINLGTVCFKFLEKETRPTPAVQQRVMDYVACWRDSDDGAQDLVARIEERLAHAPADRVREALDDSVAIAAALLTFAARERRSAGAA